MLCMETILKIRRFYHKDCLLAANYPIKLDTANLGGESSKTYEYSLLLREPLEF